MTEQSLDIPVELSSFVEKVSRNHKMTYADENGAEFYRDVFFLIRRSRRAAAYVYLYCQEQQIPLTDAVIEYAASKWASSPLVYYDTGAEYPIEIDLRDELRETLKAVFIHESRTQTNRPYHVAMIYNPASPYLSEQAEELVNNKNYPPVVSAVPEPETA